MAMNPEQIAFFGSGTVVIINIVGWVIANQRNRASITEATLAAAKAATREFTRLDETVTKLPCVRDSDYVRNNGRLLEKVEQLEKQMDRAEQKVDKVLWHLDKNGG
jgi:uncharacterized protein Yka (UPF0111/DUF47 family)